MPDIQPAPTITPKSKPSKIIRFTVIGLLLLTLLVASELIYLSRQQPSKLSLQTPHYLKLIQLSNQLPNPALALKFLSKAAEIQLRQINERYPQTTILTTATIPSLPQNQTLKTDYHDLLRDFDYNLLLQDLSINWGQIFYNLGLLAFQANEINLVIPFWQIAANIAPEWSFFHLELANFYLNSGQLDQAQAQIDFCLQFAPPQEECQGFMIDYIQTQTPAPIGFRQQRINDI